MKVFKTLTVIVIVLTLYACNNASGKDVEFSKLNNFFIKNNVVLTGAENYFIIGTQDGFSNVLGAAQTMDNNVENVDFSKYLVVVVALKSSTVEASIDVLSVKTENNNLLVNYEIKRGKERSYSTTPFVAVKIEKNNYNNVSFLEDNSLKKSFPLIETK